MFSSNGTSPGSSRIDAHEGLRKAVAAFAILFVFLETNRYTQPWFEELFAARYHLDSDLSNVMSWVATVMLLALIYHFIKSITPMVMVPLALMSEWIITRLAMFL